MWEDYKIEVEINSRFTLLSLDELKKRIDIESENSDKIETIKNLIFYKIISKDFIIFNDNQIIRDYFFSQTEKITDIAIYEQLVGLKGLHYTHEKLKKNHPLIIKSQSKTKKVRNIYRFV